ncbi:MAG: saccharopine dehydrogenase NADP-binding domain-containing protein [Chloroflexi bacterium]|nr:saccharopine dehydrogenase NADP-binding domain-containing protein [Chloroflexota bacterium]
MKIVVLGGYGDMGQGVVQDLVTHTPAEVVIADYRVEGARAFAARLGSEAGATHRVIPAFVDANDPASLAAVLEGAQAVVGAIGPFYRYATKMATAAVKAGVNYVDICDDYGPIQEVFALDEAAKAAGVTLITGLGWTPGITNLMCRLGASRLDSVDEIKIAWAGGAEDSQGLAVVMHVFYAVTGKVPTYRDGQWVEVEAGSEKEPADFGGALGVVNVFHCGHPEPMTVPRYIKARTVSLKGALTPEWNNALVDLFAKLGFTATPKRIETLSKIIHKVEHILGKGGVPFSGARVDVIGTKDGKPCTYTYRVVDKMKRLTGIPAAVGAWMLAQGQVPHKGVYAPEGCLEPEPFFAELAKRGIHIEEMMSAG